MLHIGITGGIGSGKTTVARIFEVLGIPVYYADVTARALMQEEGGLKNKLIENFGSNIYKEEKLDRSALAKIVFQAPEKLALLNSLVHPKTIAHARRWREEQSSAYTLKEAALMYESGSEKDLDYVIGVSAPEALRIQRAMQRDDLTETDIRKRMVQQMAEDEKMKRCDFVLVNDEQEFLIPQVLALHEKLLHLSATQLL